MKGGRVAILGCGPAGLLAALAAEQKGLDPHIFSHKVKSPIFGAMYVHRAIPEATPEDPELEITVIKAGTRRGYARNVYGDPDHPVSWDKFEQGEVPGWSMQNMYDVLWDRFNERITDVSLDYERVRKIYWSYPLVISTLPRRALCKKPDIHKFTSQSIWVMHGPGIYLIPSVNDNDMMYYNGQLPSEGGFPWYRFSQINGYQSWEFTNKPNMRNHGEHLILTEGFKPQSTTCGCWPGMMKIGRFGKWRRDVLTHHVYEEVERAL